MKRIAMWSGPRNISTALMRSWGSRPDAFVCDEPLYGYYLEQTGYTHHPGYQQILDQHETSWHAIIDSLIRNIPGKSIFYQKHMAHHLVGQYTLDWTDALSHVFLIRDPREMLLSLTKVIPNPSLEETGLPQQAELFERIGNRTGIAPPVLDAKDVLLNPESILRLLCTKLDVPFRSEMMNWQPGIRETDGVWAKHWYDNVAESTGFASYSPRTGELSGEFAGLLSECQTLYDRLYEHRLAMPN